MEKATLNLSKQVSILADYLKINRREIYKVKTNYLLTSFEDEKMFRVMVKHYIRMKKPHVPKQFLKMEWIVTVLFFGLGIDLAHISDLIEKPLNQVKIYFFSGKHKLLIMEESERM